MVFSSILLIILSVLIICIFKVCWYLTFSKSADYLHFQILLIFNISKVSWFVTFPKSIVCQDLHSLLHYFGYKKILGLIIGNKKQSLEARADAFSRLKRKLFFSFCFLVLLFKVYKKVVEFSLTQRKIFWILVFSIRM